MPTTTTVELEIHFSLALRLLQYTVHPEVLIRVLIQVLIEVLLVFRYTHTEFIGHVLMAHGNTSAAAAI